MYCIFLVLVPFDFSLDLLCFFVFGEMDPFRQLECLLFSTEWSFDLSRGLSAFTVTELSLLAPLTYLEIDCLVDLDLDYLDLPYDLLFTGAVWN